MYVTLNYNITGNIFMCVQSVVLREGKGREHIHIHTINIMIQNNCNIPAHKLIVILHTSKGKGNDYECISAIMQLLDCSISVHMLIVQLQTRGGNDYKYQRNSAICIRLIVLSPLIFI